MLSRAVIYSRISTPSQHNALKSQISILLNFAETAKITVDRRCSDVCSGKNPKDQLCLQSLLEYVDKHTVLIRDISRLGRDYSFTSSAVDKIHNKNSNIYSVTENLFSYQPEFLSHLENAEKNLETMKDVQKMSLDNIKENGGYTGRIPYGYKIKYVDGIPKLFVNDEEQKIIEIINNMRNNGVDYRNISITINSFSANRENEWSEASVKNIVERDLKSLKLLNF